MRLNSTPLHSTDEGFSIFPPSIHNTWLIDNIDFPPLIYDHLHNITLLHISDSVVIFFSHKSMDLGYFLVHNRTQLHLFTKGINTAISITQTNFTYSPPDCHNPRSRNHHSLASNSNDPSGWHQSTISPRFHLWQWSSTSINLVSDPIWTNLLS